MGRHVPTMQAYSGAITGGVWAKPPNTNDSPQVKFFYLTTLQPKWPNNHVKYKMPCKTTITIQYNIGLNTVVRKTVRVNIKLSASEKVKRWFARRTRIYWYFRRPKFIKDWYFLVRKGNPPQTWVIQPPKHDSNKSVLPPNRAYCVLH